MKSNPPRIKRVYDTPAKDDGFRVLVDRLWPRGLTKAKARIDLWLKDIAPSPELRKWFNHDPQRWDAFQKRYRAELKANKQALETLKEKCRQGRVTLLYGARDQQHNNAIVIRDLLQNTK